MTLYQFIEDLNKNKHTPNIGLGNLDDMGFSEDEKKFITTYRPEKSFIIYGSLAPNAPNHHIVEHIKGTWQAGIVKGQLEEKGWGVDFGYLGFKHVSGEEQKEDSSTSEDKSGDGSSADMSIDDASGDEGAEMGAGDDSTTADLDASQAAEVAGNGDTTETCVGSNCPQIKSNG